jgi:hypothetical protein
MYFIYSTAKLRCFNLTDKYSQLFLEFLHSGDGLNNLQMHLHRGSVLLPVGVRVDEGLTEHIGLSLAQMTRVLPYFTTVGFCRQFGIDRRRG